MAWPGTTPEHQATLADARAAFNRRREIMERAKVQAEFYTSSAWLRVRYDALKRFDGACHCCLCRPIRTPLHVDHIKPRSKYPELALDPANVQVLCQDCNFGKCNTDETDWRWK